MLECQKKVEGKEGLFKCGEVEKATNNKFSIIVHEKYCEKCQRKYIQFSKLIANAYKGIFSNFNLEVDDFLKKSFIFILSDNEVEELILNMYVFGGIEKEEIEKRLKEFYRYHSFNEILSKIEEEGYIFFEKQLKLIYERDIDRCKSTLLDMAKIGNVKKDYILKFVKKTGLDKS